MGKQKENGISWATHTWNPIYGCSRASRGCMSCYSEKIAHRFSGPGQPYEGLIASSGQWNGVVKLIHKKLVEPIRWRKPRLIFVNSMSDLFHESLSDEKIDQVFGVMWASLGNNHTFQILTKRARRMHEYLSTDRREAWARYAVQYGGGSDPDAIYDQVAYATNPHPRIWLGVSVEDQETVNERVTFLLDTPASVRWISAEPLIDAITLEGYVGSTGKETAALDWVVLGGESGSAARPMHPLWARKVRDECLLSGVRFHFKQWGEWAPEDSVKVDASPFAMTFKQNAQLHICERGERLYRVGKKRTTRMLDGMEYDEFPVQSTQHL